MSRLVIHGMMVGPIQTNCYLISDVDSKEALIVDPGAEPERIQQVIHELGLLPCGILLTHAHWDHINGCAGLKAAYDIPVYISEKERDTLTDAGINLSEELSGQTRSYQADVFLRDDEEVRLSENLHFVCLSTPGHTPGGACFYFPEEGVLFSGDTLFQYSVGRTDFPGGSMSQLVRSIREKLVPLPDETEVLPGHGPGTSIGDEREMNPYV